MTAANLTADFNADESQTSVSSSYIQTQPFAAAAASAYLHPKINPSHLTPLDASFFDTTTSASQLPSSVTFLAVVLGVSLETIGGKGEGGRYWSLGKVKVHDGKKERVIECWEDVSGSWCDGQGVRGKLRRLDVVWFQSEYEVKTASVSTS